MTPEQLVKNDVCSYIFARRDVFFWLNSSVGVFDPIRKIYRKNNSPYALNGTSDVLGIFKSGPLAGKFVAIEVKSAKGKPTSEQLTFIAQVNDFGGIGIIVYSLNDCITKLTKRVEELTLIVDKTN